MKAAHEAPVPPAAWRRLLAVAALLTLLLATAKATGDAPQDETPPLPQELSELARKYAAVAEWRGIFDASETGSVSWTSVGGDNRGFQSVDRKSRGHFRIQRNTSYGWEPERGMFQWGADNEVSGEITVADDIQSSGWHKGGQGQEWRDQLSGTAPAVGPQFGIWLDRKHAWIRVGDPNEARMLYQRVGRIVYDEGRGDGLVHLKTMSLNKTERQSGFLPPFRSDFWTSAATYRVAAQGPGVLHFQCVGKEIARTQQPQITHRSRVTLFPIYDDLEVKVTIEGYEKWLPKGSLANRSMPGNHLSARAMLVPKAGGAKTPTVKCFRFELVDASREPGVCMNWPLLGADDDQPPEKDPAPDLRFAADHGAILTKENLSAELKPVQNSEGRESASARIDSYDFGGTAELQVVCVLEGGREICGVLETGESQLLPIPIPYRRGGSRIARAWQERNKVSGADGDDLDDQPVGDGNRGDGFSTFEEYRGFVWDRAHHRTRPGHKDLFVHNAIGKKAMDGIYLFTDRTHLDVRYELRRDEMPLSRRMNVNRSPDSPRASQEHQHGLVLDLIDGAIASEAVIEGDVWRPKHTTMVVILKSLLAPEQSVELAATIAHELLHAIGVHHHGETDLGNVEWVRKERMANGILESWFEERQVGWDSGAFAYLGQAFTIRLLRPNGSEIRAQDFPKLLTSPVIKYVGCHGGQHSGVVDCVTRYDCANAFKLPGRPRDRILSPGEPTGMGLCTTAVGTAFNAPAPGQKDHSTFVRYGDATRGGCCKQFGVRDDAPHPPVKP